MINLCERKSQLQCVGPDELTEGQRAVRIPNFDAKGDRPTELPGATRIRLNEDEVADVEVCRFTPPSRPSR